MGLNSGQHGLPRDESAAKRHTPWFRSASKAMVCAPFSVVTVSIRRIAWVSNTSITPGSPMATYRCLSAALNTILDEIKQANGAADKPRLVLPARGGFGEKSQRAKNARVHAVVSPPLR
jgi:hypothetical protein